MTPPTAAEDRARCFELGGWAIIPVRIVSAASAGPDSAEGPQATWSMQSTFQIWARGVPDPQIRLGWWDRALRPFRDVMFAPTTSLGVGRGRSGEETVVCRLEDPAGRWFGLAVLRSDLEIVRATLAALGDEAP